MHIVTGTKRSGTSMWMQLLRAAGFPPIGEALPRIPALLASEIGLTRDFALTKAQEDLESLPDAGGAGPRGKKDIHMKRFDGKTVVVTGASSGIGESCARKFAAEGAKVVVAARSAEPLQRLVDDLGRDVALAVLTDVSDLGACERLLEQAKSRFGSIDVLVNNAAYNCRGPVASLAVEQMLQMLDVNLRAPMVLTRLVLPTMQSQGSGTIVNVASLAGRFPLEDEASYSTTKFGLRVFSFALAEELRDSNVRVCVVSPGPVDTGFITNEGIIDTVPPLVFSQPMSTADEIADLVLASAADGARERVKPAIAGKLATLGYLVPSLRRLLIPVFERKGEREKRKYIARHSR